MKSGKVYFVNNKIEAKSDCWYICVISKGHIKKMTPECDVTVLCSSVIIIIMCGKATLSLIINLLRGNIQQYFCFRFHYAGNVKEQ